MDIKIKKNPAYENVKGTVKTGMTKDQVEVISDKVVAKRKSEIFTRINRKGLYELLCFEKPAESIYKLGGSNDDNNSTFTANSGVS